MIPAVFSPYADRAPKAWARLASHQAAVASVLNSSSCGCGSRKPKAAPPRVKTDAKRCRRRGSCSPSVASHGARGSERSECRCILSRPNIEARRGEPSRDRETYPTATIGIRGLSGATSTYLIFFLRNLGRRIIFAAGFRVYGCPRRRGGAAHEPLPPRRAALDAHATRTEQPSQAQPPWPPTGPSTSSSTSTASGMLIYLVGASTWSARP